MNIKKFKYFTQIPHQKGCGAACLRMIADYYGENRTMDYFLKETRTNEDGTSLYMLSKAASKVGLTAEAVKLKISAFDENIPLPCIAFLPEEHFIVILKISRRKIQCVDPRQGKLSFDKNAFLKSMENPQDNTAILLLFNVESSMN